MEMAKQKKKPFVHLEMSLGGLLGLGVVAFCIFLWMFLFGIWAGQTVLQPAGGGAGVLGLGGVASSLLARGKAVEWKKAAGPAAALAPIEEAGRAGDAEESEEGPGEGKPEPLAPVNPAVVASAPETSFFSLQVAAVSEQKEAVAAVLRWRARGQDAFYLEPEGAGEKGYRVYIGNFENLGDANGLAARLEDNGKPVKSFITLVGAARQRRP